MMRVPIPRVCKTGRHLRACLDAAISELSFKCNPADTARALYLVSAPSKEMNLSVIKELGEYLKSLTPEAIIRNGDYPRERGALDVSVILSELKDVEKVRRYYLEAAQVVSTIKKRQIEIDAKLKEIDEGDELFRSRVTPELYKKNFYDRAIIDLLVKSKGHIKCKLW